MHAVSTVPHRFTALVAALAACLLACAFLVTAPAATAAPAGTAPAGAAAVDEPSAWMTAGSLAPCDAGSCRYLVVHWENLGDGMHQVACWAGPTPEFAGWHDIPSGATTWAGSVKYTVEGDSGSAQLPCSLGRSDNGTQIRPVVDGAFHAITTWRI